MRGLLQPAQNLAKTHHRASIDIAATYGDSPRPNKTYKRLAESHPLRHLSPQLARWYPFLPSGDTPEQQKIQHKLAERLQKLGGMTPELSKKIGFGGE
jgi:hypothetical protein